MSEAILEKDYLAEDVLISKSPVAYRILRFLINNMDGYEAVACSYQVLQEELGVSQVTIARAIRVLKEGHYISIYKLGTSNVYFIGQRKRLGNIVQAKVIISETEQRNLVK